MNLVGRGIVNAFYPDPTNDATSRNFIHSPELVQDLHLGTTRVDWNPSANDSFMVRYQVYWDDQVNPNVAGTLPRLAETIIKKNQNLGFQWTKVWNPTTVQEVRIGWGRIRNARLSSDTDDWNALLGITGTTSESVKDRLTVGPPRQCHRVLVHHTVFQPVHPHSQQLAIRVSARAEPRRAFDALRG